MKNERVKSEKGKGEKVKNDAFSKKTFIFQR